MKFVMASCLNTNIEMVCIKYDSPLPVYAFVKRGYAFSIFVLL